jgi:hypothetical protein
MCGEIETHTGRCTPCAEFTDSLRKTVDLCRNYEPRELPGPLVKDARQRLLEAYHQMLAAHGR